MRLRVLLALLVGTLALTSTAAAQAGYARAGFALDGVTEGGGATHDQAAGLYFNDLATMGWDPYDATKLPPLTSPASQIAPLGPGPDGEPRRLAQRSMPLSLTAPVTATIAFMTTKGGTFTFSMPIFTGIPAGWELTLTDSETGTVTALGPGVTYAFTSEATDYTERFSVTVTPSVVTGTEAPAPAPAYVLDPLAPNPSTAGARTTLQVRDAQRVRAEVVDVLGRHVATVFDGALAADAPQTLTVDTAALPAGLYVLRVFGTAFNATQAFSATR